MGKGTRTPISIAISICHSDPGALPGGQALPKGRDSGHFRGDRGQKPRLHWSRAGVGLGKREAGEGSRPQSRGCCSRGAVDSVLSPRQGWTPPPGKHWAGRPCGPQNSSQPSAAAPRCRCPQVVWCHPPVLLPFPLLLLENLCVPGLLAGWKTIFVSGIARGAVYLHVS